MNGDSEVNNLVLSWVWMMTMAMVQQLSEVTGDLKTYSIQN